MHSNLKATRLNSSGQVSPGSIPCHVVAYHIVVAPSSAAGTLVLNNGGSGGTAIVTLDTPITAAGQFVVSDNMLPGMGVWFTADCYATLAAGQSVTIFWY